MFENHIPVDILILAFIAIVVLYRLYQKFGTHVDVDDPKDDQNTHDFNADRTTLDHDLKRPTSQDHTPKDKFLSGNLSRKSHVKDRDSVAEKRAEPLLNDKQAQEIAESVMQSDVADRLKSMRDVDPSFDMAEFLQGAAVAYEMLTTAMVAGDIRTLRTLTADTLFDTLCADIKQRQQDGHSVEAELIGIEAMHVRDIELEDGTATIVVAIESEQSYAVYDENRDLVAGDNENMLFLCDVWHLRRDLRQSNPNWTLVDIVEENDSEESDNET